MRVMVRHGLIDGVARGLTAAPGSHLARLFSFLAILA